MKAGNTALGILVGISVGALFGILLAPEKGSTTRKKIMGKGQDYVDDLKNKFDSLYEEATDKYDNFLAEAKAATISHKV